MTGAADELWAAVVALQTVANQLAAVDRELQEDAQRLHDLTADLWHIVSNIEDGAW